MKGAHEAPSWTQTALVQSARPCSDLGIRDAHFFKWVNPPAKLHKQCEEVGLLMGGRLECNLIVDEDTKVWLKTPTQSLMTQSTVSAIPKSSRITCQIGTFRIMHYLSTKGKGQVKARAFRAYVKQIVVYPS